MQGTAGRCKALPVAVWPKSGSEGRFTARKRYRCLRNKRSSEPYEFIGFGAIDVTKPYDMALELICGADLCGNRHCRASPIGLKRFWGQVWPNIGRKPKIIIQNCK